MLVDDDAQEKTDDEQQADSNEESDTDTEEKDDDDSVQGNAFGNQAALPSTSDGASNDNTVLVDNDAQENTDEAKQAASKEESDIETEEKNDDDKSSSSWLQNLQRGLGVTGMVKQLVYQHKFLPTKKTPRRNVFTAEWIYHGFFTSFMRYCPVDDLKEYRKAMHFSLSNRQQCTKTTKITPCMKLNEEVATWCQKLKAILTNHNHYDNIAERMVSLPNQHIQLIFQTATTLHP